MINPMKDSGVEWIGEIPYDWQISKIKYTTKLNGRIGWQGLTSSEYQDEGPFLITGTDFKDGRINFDSAVHIEESRWAEAKQIQVENGDLLITKDGTVGKVAIIDALEGRASLNSGVLRIQTTDEVNRKYLYYVLLSEEFWLWFNYTNSGASTILHLYQNVFERFTYVNPPLQEQKAIANFLDIETEKLDNVKGLLQQQIEKLKGYRKSLIWETVTKGLDKTVPIKDSGVDWINSRLKYHITIKSGESIVNDNLVDDGGFPAYGGGRLIGYTNNSNVSKDEIIVGRVGANAGQVMELVKDSWATDNALIVYSKNVYTRYAYYLLDCLNLNRLNDSSAQPLITASKVLNQAIYIPRLKSEQQTIANFLDEKTTLIEEVISNIQVQIEVINKLNKTLIYDYVTGKRRVKL